MSTKDDDKDKAIEFFLETVETQGVAVSSVTDGHILMFKTSFLQEMLDKYKDQEKISFFIKQPQFKN